MSQCEKLLTILKDHEPHTVPELIKKVYGLDKPSSARLASRVYDLKKRGYTIISNALTGTKWMYQLIKENGTKWKV